MKNKKEFTETLVNFKEWKGDKVDSFFYPFIKK